jgi:hypothetical protein
MKKFLTAVFLAAALVAPAFASDTDLELIPKLGYLFSPEVTLKADGQSVSDSKDSAISFGAELFFDMQNNFFLGGGLIWAENHKFTEGDMKVGFTNVYAAAKYKLLASGSEEDPFYLYPLVQIGAGLPGWEYSGMLRDFEVAGGFYWGLGIGGEVKNIVIELIYGCNYATMKASNAKDTDMTYTAFRINVGYKFIL